MFVGLVCVWLGSFGWRGEAYREASTPGGLEEGRAEHRESVRSHWLRKRGRAEVQLQSGGEVRFVRMPGEEPWPLSGTGKGKLLWK